LTHLGESAAHEAKLALERQSLIDRIQEYFGSLVPDWEFDQLLTRLSLSDEEQVSLDRLFKNRWQNDLLQTGRVTSIFLEQLLENSRQSRAAAEKISDYLELGKSTYWSDHVERSDIVEAIADLAPIPELWVQSRGIEHVNDAVARGIAALDQLLKSEEALMSEYELGLLDIVDNPMLVRYRTDYRSGFRRFFSSKYRADRNAIGAFRKASQKATFEEDANTVGKALDLKRVLSEWESLEPELSEKLGSRFFGRNTDWDMITQDLERVQSLLGSTTPGSQVIASRLTDVESSSICRRILEASRLAKDAFVSCLTSPVDSGIVDDFIDLKPVPTKITWDSLEGHAGRALSAATRIETSVEGPLKSAQKPFDSLDSLKSLLGSCSRFRVLEQEQAGSHDALASDFGNHFIGIDTDWAAMSWNIRWAQELLELITPDLFSTTFMTHVQNPESSTFYTDISQSISEAIREFRGRVEPIVQAYDMSKSRVPSFETARFDEIKEWSQELSSDADSAGDWLLYEAAVKDLDNIVAPSTTELIRHETDDSELVPVIVERRILGAWLDHIYKDERILREFAVLEHEDRRARFQELDELSIQTAENEVRRKVFENYPNLGPTSARSSELGVLQGELSKTRRQWPVRRLFNRIPHLLQTVKPCFMMSPLAVSQWLPYSEDSASTLKFDVVIFDEASQVFPEDAVPAILRAEQLILAGDQKQLPPTSYYRTRLSDDDDDSFDDDDVDDSPMTGRDSILDVAVGMRGGIFNESRLDVHYRSKDERLIRFSNHHFYDDKLLTFPAPGQPGSWNGVHDVYLPDGRYDAGASRTNRIEAERVVDLVFEHMRTRPLDESVGIVALSRPQSDLIQELVDQRRLKETTRTRRRRQI